MERRKITPVLLAILAAAAVFLAAYFAVMYRNINYLPGEALDNLCEILSADSIRIDRNIVPLKREKGTIYVCESDGYSENVAKQLGGSDIKYRFATPDGETMLLYNGAILEFASGFAFRYRSDQTVSYTDGALSEDDTDGMRTLSPGSAKDVEDAVTAFLEGGNRSFDDRDKLNLVTKIRQVYEENGIYYVECVRTIDELEITENRVVCVVCDGKVAEAVGKWCFLTLGQSYSSQLTDVFNILFNVKKEIDGIRASGDPQRVTVEAINRCYTLYYLEDDEGFCFIPCWQIVTDIYGNFIYNAVDGTLYTKK